MPQAISIGCQQGGPNGGYISEVKVALWRSLSKHVTSTHCEAIDEYAIVLRVDGSLSQFGEEGLSRLRFAKSRRYITVDIQIPETAWRPLNRNQTKHYLSKQVTAAIESCTTRLARDKYAVNESALKGQITAALQEFLASQDAA